jgi:1,4-alpha-glucan branching enzyme
MKRSHNHTATLSRPLSRRRNPQREGAQTGRRIEVELTLQVPRAEKVFVAGDFNQWRAGDMRLRRDEVGCWRTQLWLEPGRYEYRFIVDDDWYDDPHALVHVPNDFGSSNCVLEVQFPAGK